MGRYDDIDPSDIDPETNAPYAGYSSPALDTSFHDIEMDVEDPETASEIALEALRKWKCPSCGGRKVYLNRTRDGAEELPCEVCQESGLHPYARAAVASIERLEAGADDDGYPPPCTNRRGHSWVCQDDDEETSYCEWCGADGNA
jgi:hypothetical protein